MTNRLSLASPRLSPAAPEADLVAAAARGEGAAFEVLMRCHNQLVFRTARSILPSDAEAEEAAQDAWLNAWRALDRFRGESRFATWIVVKPRPHWPTSRTATPSRNWRGHRCAA